MQTLIDSLGGVVSPEQYVHWTRIQCTAWTAADIVIVYYVLRMANFARSVQHLPRHVISWMAWGLTLPMAALVPLAWTGQQIFVLELAITIPHFLIIVYILLLDANHFAAALATLLDETPRNPTAASET